MGGEIALGRRAQIGADPRPHREADGREQVVQLRPGVRRPRGHRLRVTEPRQQGVRERRRYPLGVLVRGQPLQQQPRADRRHREPVEAGRPEQGGRGAADDQRGPQPVQQHIGRDGPRGVQHGQLHAQPLRLGARRRRVLPRRVRVRCEHQPAVAQGRGPAHHLPPQPRLLGRRDQPGPGEILPQQQRARPLDGGQIHLRVRQFTDDPGDRLGRHGPLLHPVLAQQQQPRPRDQVRMEQPSHPDPGQRGDLLPGRAVAAGPLRVHIDGDTGEDLGEGPGGTGVRGVDDELQLLVAETPGAPEVALPQRGVVRPGRPAGRVEGGDRVVPREDLVEPGAQPLEAGGLRDVGDGLRDRPRPGQQQDPAVGLGEAARVDRRGEQHRRGGRGGVEDPDGHAAEAPFAATGRRRSLRTRVARVTSMASSASSRSRCGRRPRAAAPRDFSSRATAGSHASRAPR